MGKSNGSRRILRKNESWWKIAKKKSRKKYKQKKEARLKDD